MWMNKLQLCAGIALTLCAAAAPFAQQAEEGVVVRSGDRLMVNGREVARLRNVEGNVLVSQETGLASGNEAARVHEGARVITTAKARVTIVFDDGCEVTLEENQRIEIDSRRACAMRLAEGVTGDPQGAIGLVGGVSFLTGFGTYIGITGVGILIDDRESNAVSPS